MTPSPNTPGPWPAIGIVAVALAVVLAVMAIRK